ncbi:MAG: ABC transporter ATP-binding protein [Methylotenera sp.]|nr:ABC transporter ATP-binding protein [Oligoflexia bacterium]
MGILLTDIRKSFGSPPTQVLKGISLEIQEGEFVSIVGRSGCGKSTLLYIMSTLDPPSSGTVLIDGQDVNAISSRELHRFRNLKMGFVFQFHHLLPELNALENVLMPAMKANRQEERKAFAISLMEEFGLGKKLKSFPGQLSGGEQQRVAIARGLVMEPRYLFADEPTGNLDSANGNAVMSLFRRINQEQKMAVIYVTHDIDFSKMAERTIQMSDGLVLS